MAKSPTRITDLQSPDAVKVLNSVVETINHRLDSVEQAALNKRLTSTSTLVFGTVSGNSCKETIVNIPGASTDLVAHANPVLSLGSTNLTWTAYVSAKGQVKVRVCNPTTSPIAVNTVRWNILVS